MTPATPRPEGERTEPGAWLAVVAGTLGAFMATLDISIVNAALPTIQGEIGASATEGTWITTAYLVAEIVIIPLSAWLVRLLGLRSFLLLVAGLFTAFSILCGLSTSLAMIIVGRSGQGLSGGAMIPTAMTIIATRLPPHRQMMGNALFGMTAILGPVLGPLVGGMLTDTVSWRAAFFINLPIGIALATLLLTGLRHERSNLGLIREADWLGIGGMTLGLGCLTVVLEEGQREQWFESALILRLCLAAGLGFALLLAGQMMARRPVIRLRLLLDPQFGSVVMMGILLGMVLYGTSYLIPQFLAAIADYNASQAGRIVLLGGVPSLILMPLTPLLMRGLDIRIAVALGLLTMAVSCWLETGLTADSVGGDFVLSQLLRGVGQVLGILFLNQAAMTSVPPDQAGDAAGLFNAARNMGGSIALAGIATLQDQRLWLHSRRIEETLSANAVSTHDYLTLLGQGESVAGMVSLARIIQQQALVMTFNDLFWLLGTGVAVVTVLVVFLRPLRSGAEAMAR
ncbi:DHA2 family efflux MFS transporter permease subunit [Phaeospirillum tilakii]|uniref:DHA2 family efflux MFS transporter permease subunit n=1 Tax=Phaeospirillum tilakii TaxID=741673 RepID=A0ABW5CE32_9PROT